MPYIPRMKYVYLTFVTPLRSFIDPDAIVGDYALNPVTLPTLKGNIVGLQVDLNIGNMEDTSGAANYLNGVQQIEMDVDAGGYDSVIDLTGSFSIFANAQMTAPQPKGNFILNSALTKPIVWGSVLTFRWGDGKVAGDDLTLYDLQCVVHLLVRF